LELTLAASATSAATKVLWKPPAFESDELPSSTVTREMVHTFVMAGMDMTLEYVHEHDDSAEEHSSVGRFTSLNSVSVLLQAGRVKAFSVWRATAN
jgi:hypothetical protein